MEKPTIDIRSAKDLGLLKKKLHRLRFNTMAGATDPGVFKWILAYEDGHTRTTVARIAIRTDYESVWRSVEKICKARMEWNPWQR